MLNACTSNKTISVKLSRLHSTFRFEQIQTRYVSSYSFLYVLIRGKLSNQVFILSIGERILTYVLR